MPADPQASHPEGAITNWTTTTLTKFIREIFKRDPISFLTSLEVDDLVINGKLTVSDRSDFSGEVWRTISKSDAPPFANGWANFGSGWQVAQYTKEPATGFVVLRGLVSSGTVGNAAFTLPPGFRPIASETFPSISNGAVGRVDVNPDGTVVPNTPTSNVWVSISGIRFRTS